MTNADLELDPQIFVSQLRGEPIEEAIAELERIARVVDARRRHLREQPGGSPPTWPGQTTTVVIAPSTFLWDSPRARELVQEIAETARSAGVRLHLIADAQEITPGSGEYPICHYGTAAVRALASRPTDPVVTFTSMTREEMATAVDRK